MITLNNSDNDGWYNDKMTNDDFRKIVRKVKTAYGHYLARLPTKYNRVVVVV